MGASRQEARLLFVALHGFHCSASDVLPWCAPLAAVLPEVRFLIPSAPDMRISAHGGPHAEAAPSWFDYLTDHGGAQEDEIRLCTLRYRRLLLVCSIQAELRACDMKPEASLVLAGISQGGCMALDLAAHMKCLAVFTFVAHPLYASPFRGQTCKWFALSAERDSVFDPRWCNELHEAATVHAICKGDHWISNSACERFVLAGMRHLAQRPLSSALRKK